MELHISLATITRSTFEELGFFLPRLEAEETDAPGEGEPMIGICFDGAIRGELVLRLTGAALPELAANMLGAQVAPAAELHFDALGEVGNVICGSVLAELAGPAARFRLAPPAVRSGSPGPPADGTLRAAARVHFEEGSVEVWLCTFEHPDPAGVPA